MPKQLHTSGNLALNGLYELVCPLVELLRLGHADMEQVAELFVPVRRAYELTLRGIESMGIE